MVFLYGRAGRLAAETAVSGPGQVFLLELPPHEGSAKQLEATLATGRKVIKCRSQSTRA